MLAGIGVLVSGLTIAILLAGNFFGTNNPVQEAARGSSKEKQDKGGEKPDKGGEKPEKGGGENPPPAQPQCLPEEETGLRRELQRLQEETLSGKIPRTGDRSGTRTGSFSWSITPKSGYGGKHWHLAHIADFACEMEVRLRDTSGGCARYAARRRDSSRNLEVGLNGAGEVFVQPWPWDQGPQQEPWVPPTPHVAIKPAGAFNKMLVVVRGPEVTVSINGVPVIAPVKLAGASRPGNCCS